MESEACVGGTCTDKCNEIKKEFIATKNNSFPRSSFTFCNMAATVAVSFSDFSFMDTLNEPSHTFHGESVCIRRSLHLALTNFLIKKITMHPVAHTINRRVDEVTRGQRVKETCRQVSWSCQMFLFSTLGNLYVILILKKSDKYTVSIICWHEWFVSLIYSLGDESVPCNGCKGHVALTLD